MSVVPHANFWQRLYVFCVFFMLLTSVMAFLRYLWLLVIISVYKHFVEIMNKVRERREKNDEDFEMSFLEIVFCLFSVFLLLIQKALAVVTDVDFLMHLLTFLILFHTFVKSCGIIYKHSLFMVYSEE